MICAKCRWLKLESLVVFTLTAVLIAASTKKKSDGDLRIVAEAGRIEEPPLMERENAGIYNLSLEEKNYFGGLILVKRHSAFIAF